MKVSFSLNALAFVLGPILLASSNYAYSQSASKVKSNPILSNSSYLSSKQSAQPIGSSTFQFKKPTQIEKKWSLPISLSSESTLHRYDDYEKEDGMSLKLAPAYKLSNTWSLGSEILAFQEFTKEKRYGFDQTLVFAKHKNAINSNFDFTQSGFAILPTDRETSEKQTFLGAVVASLDLEFKEISIFSKLNFSQSLKRNIHEFSQDADGKFNTEYSTTSNISTEIPLSESFGLSAGFKYITAWAYEGGQSYSYKNFIDLGYSPTKTTSLDISISNEGNALKPNGTDSNIEILNDQSTRLGLSFTYVL